MNKLGNSGPFSRSVFLHNPAYPLPPCPLALQQAPGKAVLGCKQMGILIGRVMWETAIPDSAEAFTVL